MVLTRDRLSLLNTTGEEREITDIEIAMDAPFSNTKHYNIEIYPSSIAQSTDQYFPVLLSCRSNMENQFFQY